MAGFGLDMEHSIERNRLYWQSFIVLLVRIAVCSGGHGKVSWRRADSP
jgi:hypothetical protein